MPVPHSQADVVRAIRRWIAPRDGLVHRARAPGLRLNTRHRAPLAVSPNSARGRASTCSAGGGVIGLPNTKTLLSAEPGVSRARFRNSELRPPRGGRAMRVVSPEVHSAPAARSGSRACCAQHDRSRRIPAGADDDARLLVAQHAIVPRVARHHTSGNEKCATTVGDRSARSAAEWNRNGWCGRMRASMPRCAPASTTSWPRSAATRASASARHEVAAGAAACDQNLRNSCGLRMCGLRIET